MHFISARESRLFIRLFRIYVKLLFKRRFKKVWLRQDYHPTGQSKTVYYLNHNSWWDGLIPFILNEYRFQQQARAMMEKKQIKRYPFFSKIGAFSIHNQKKNGTIVASMRYAVKSMQRPNACLFIYPEGKIQPSGTPMKFQDGLSWLHDQLPDVDFVPIGIYINTIRSDKPELHLYVGKAVTIEKETSKLNKLKIFENSLDTLLQKLRGTAGFDDAPYELFFR